MSSLQIFMKTPNTRITKCSFSICQSSWSGPCSRLDCSYPAIVCPISNAWDSICPFNTPTLFSARPALHSCLRTSDFAPASNFSFVVNPKMILIWPSTNSWQDLRFCVNHTTGCLVLAKIDCAPWNKPSSLINLPQTGFNFSLLCTQWHSKRISDVLVVNLSIGRLRIVVSKVVDCLDTREVVISKSSEVWPPRWAHNLWEVVFWP